MADKDLASAAHKLASAQAAMLQEARHAVEALLEPYGLSIDDLASTASPKGASAGRKKASAKKAGKKKGKKSGRAARTIKYRFPDGTTWEGGGDMHAKMRDAIDRGINPKKFLTDPKLPHTPQVQAAWDAHQSGKPAAAKKKTGKKKAAKKSTKKATKK